MYHFEMAMIRLFLLVIMLVQTGCLSSTDFQSSSANSAESETDNVNDPTVDEEHSQIREIAGPSAGDGKILSGGLTFVVLDSESQCPESKFSDVITMNLVPKKYINTLAACETSGDELSSNLVDQIDPTRLRYGGKVYVLLEIVEQLKCKKFESPAVDSNGHWSCASKFLNPSTDQLSTSLVTCASEGDMEKDSCLAAANFKQNNSVDQITHFPLLCYDLAGQPTRTELSYESERWYYAESSGSDTGWLPCNNELPVVIIDLKHLNGYESLFQLQCQTNKFSRVIADSTIWHKSEVPSGVDKILVFLWGGGGSGSSSVHWSGDGGQAGGGGGGQARFSVFQMSQLPDQVSVTIGKGGHVYDPSGEIILEDNQDRYGAPGKDSSFGLLLTAHGGAGGLEDNFQGMGGVGGGARMLNPNTSGWGTQGVGYQIYAGGTGGRGVQESEGPGYSGMAALFGGAGGNAAGSISATSKSRFGGSGGFGTYGSADASPGATPGGGGGAAENGLMGPGGNGLLIMMNWCDPL